MSDTIKTKIDKKSNFLMEQGTLISVLFVAIQYECVMW
jgi:hypothetical protein